MEKSFMCSNFPLPCPWRKLWLAALALSHLVCICLDQWPAISQLTGYIACVSFATIEHRLLFCLSLHLSCCWLCWSSSFCLVVHRNILRLVPLLLLLLCRFILLPLPCPLSPIHSNSSTPIRLFLGVRFLLSNLLRLPLMQLTPPMHLPILCTGEMSIALDTVVDSQSRLVHI